MAFKLTYEELNSPGLTDGLRQLGAKELPMKAAWNITRMIKQIDKNIQEGREFYFENVLKKHVEVDEKGEIVPDTHKEDVKNADGTVKIVAGSPIAGSYVAKDKEKLQSAVEEFMKTQVDIESYKIHLDDVADVRIAPQVLAAIEPVVMTRQEALDQIQKENSNVLPMS